MKKYNVHYGMRLVTDITIYANSEEEAKEAARLKVMDIDYSEFEFADDDYDIWEED